MSACLDLNAAATPSYGTTPSAVRWRRAFRTPVRPLARRMRLDGKRCDAFVQIDGRHRSSQHMGGGLRSQSEVTNRH
jgi:hypothetical protein